eukprot:213909_1
MKCSKLLFGVCLLALSHVSNCFYLPGVAPHEYAEGDRIDLKVVKLSSTHTLEPFDFYHLPFCRPDKIQVSSENLGEILTGDQISNSAYDIKMNTKVDVKVLCRKNLDKKDVGMFEDFVKSNYYAHWSMDNLPAATTYQTRVVRTSGSTQEENIETRYRDGYPIGFTVHDFATSPQANELLKKDPRDRRAYINNHVNIKVMYHTDEGAFKGSRIVGFEVKPKSILYSAKDEAGVLAEYEKKKSSFEPQALNSVNDKQEVWFTYSVEYEPSSTRWASRWDNYLKMGDAQIHWLSIINSCMIVLFLTGMVALIMIRALRKDFIRYNQLADDPEAQQEETGWKLVHGDVFRPPRHGGLFSVLVGTGCQVFSMTLLTMLFAVVGFLSPANRGGLMTCCLILFVFMGTFAGFFSARTYKMFGLTDWRKNTLMTALFFPGINFATFFVLNLLVWGEESSGAVPFGTMFALLVLWFGISVPLVYLGAYWGYRKPEISAPVKVNLIPRQIPEQAWYMQPPFSVLVGGVLPFGAVFIEVFFIMSSLWLDQFYYLFGFLFMVFVILVITCAEITLVMCYFQLCAEDYEWWWRSFMTSGSSALYLFMYSALYFFTKLDIISFKSSLLFFGYMGLISFAFFVVTGTVGYFATFLFVRKIYSSIKID